MATPPSYTTTELIAQSKRIANVPLNDTTVTAVDILSFGDAELRTSILSQILSVQEGYYRTFKDIAVNATGRYSIPGRAIGMRVSDVQMVDGDSVWNLARIEPRQLSSATNPPTNTYAFYLEGNDIVTVPPLPSGVCRVYYYVRPGMLVATSSCGQILSIVGNDVTVSALPSGYAVATLVDFQQANPPFGILVVDAQILAVNTNTLTFTTVPTTLAVGDWICLAGTSCIPQLPAEFHPLLAQRIAVKILERQGYLSKMEAAQKKLLEMEKALLGILSPRAEGNAKKITPNRNLVSPSARGGRWFVS
ncbi:MAG: hypothetical protein H0U59_14050 [Gemmatimonadaceae bacterium]|nr:hypothetical protein [Gemmatimonadaceae bacterium]